MFLEYFTEIFRITETGQLWNLGDGMLLFFQKLGGMFQSNQPDVVSRSLVGQCLYLIVEAGPTHIQQVAEHVDVEAWVVLLSSYIRTAD